MAKRKPPQELPKPLAYREGKRIRHTDGSGYGDFVEDSAILTNILADSYLLSSGDPLSAAKRIRFAVAVLTLRIEERAANGRPRRLESS